MEDKDFERITKKVADKAAQETQDAQEETLDVAIGYVKLLQETIQQLGENSKRDHAVKKWLIGALLASVVINAVMLVAWVPIGIESRLDIIHDVAHVEIDAEQQDIRQEVRHNVNSND